MTIQHNYLSTPETKPLANESSQHEIVINQGDGTLWSKDSNDVVIQVGGSGTGGAGVPVFDVITTDTSLEIETGTLADMTNISYITLALPAPEIGDWITIGDYNGTCSILKPIIITSNESIHGSDEDLYITSSNTILTLSYIDATIGWKIVDGIGEDGLEAPYEEVIIQNTNMASGTHTLPDGYTWGDFEYITMVGYYGSNPAPARGGDTFSKEIIYDGAQFVISSSSASTNIINTVTITYPNTYSLDANNGGIKLIKGFTKYKPILSAAGVIETGRTATSWYRKWSDGFIEQGGVYDAGTASSGTMPLITPFTDVNYIFITNTLLDTTVGAISIREENRNTRSLTEVDWSSYNNAGSITPHNISWMASGY